MAGAWNKEDLAREMESWWRTTFRQEPPGRTWISERINEAQTKYLIAKSANCNRGTRLARPSLVLEQLNSAQWHVVDPANHAYRSGAQGWCSALATALNSACLLGTGVESITLDHERVVLMRGRRGHDPAALEAYGDDPPLPPRSSRP